jgi:ABC-type phosphate transport system substrate-binding protein
MRRLTTFLIVLALSALLPADASRAATPAPGELSGQQMGSTEPLAIVVNRANPVENLSSAELQTIFLGGRSHWTNGRRITLVMRDPGEPERKTILRDVCGMNEDQLKTHFLHGLFTGEILVSPKILSTPIGVRKFIFNVPGAIGYLRVSDVDSTVKIVHVDELLPGEKGYKLYVQNEAAN